MSSIMRGDQTVSLIQQYHAHYPEIARNTQDVEGRKQRVHMWAKITEALNAQYSTNFTVEQFKKKVQNVQCTSRQKMQSGKRNLGDAEMEYMRLFEHDRLNGVEATSRFAGFGIDDYSAAISRSRSASRTANGGGIGEDFNANSLSANCKLLEMSLGIKSEIVNNKNNDGEEGRATEVDEDELRSRTTPSTSTGNEINGGTMNATFNDNNISNGDGPVSAQGSGPPLANLDNAQQLLLAMMANYNNSLNPAAKETANESDNSAVTNANVTKNLNTVAETLLATIKNAACRKRKTNLLTDNNVILNNNNNNSSSNNNNIIECANKNTNNANVENLVDGLNATAASNENMNNNSDSLPSKRRRKQAHALHLSNLRPVEANLRMVSPSLETHTSEAAATSALLNATTLDTPNASSASESLLSVMKEKISPNLLENWDSETWPNSLPNSDNQRWRSDITEVQKAILDNQRRILDIMERQTLQREEEREMRLRRVSSPPSPPLNARQQNGPRPTTAAADVATVSELATVEHSSERILQNLCDKIEKLANTLVSIDATIKFHFRLGTADNVNSINHKASSEPDTASNSECAHLAGKHLNELDSAVSVSEEVSLNTVKMEGSDA